MRRAILLAATVLATVTVGAAAQAQESYHVRGPLPLRFDVRPRSWLDSGNTIEPYSSVNPASAYGQTVSYLSSPPYINMADRFGGLGNGALPDPVTNGPFVGSQNILGPVDYNGFWGYSVKDR